MKWRNGVRGALCSAAVGLLLARAAAAGTINGIEVDPSPACVDEEVTATVKGTGTCAAIRIQWSADAGDTTTLNDMSFPATATHTYDTAGDYTVRAGPESADCSMQAQVDLTVETCGMTIGPIASADALEGLLEALWTPRIEFAFGIIEPGGPLVVGGNQFGLATGKVWIEGAFGKRQLTVTQFEGDDEWHNGGIGALMPAASQLTGMDGPGDLTFELWVETAAGRESNHWRLRFLEEVKVLPSDSVQVLSCGDDGNHNHCNSVSHEGDSCLLEPMDFSQFATVLLPDPGIIGSHHNCWGAIGDDVDTDRYQIRLKNGWALQSFEFEDDLPSDIGNAVSPSGFQPGATSWDPAVEWLVTPGDTIVYNAQIWIVGPKGISHQ